MEKQNHSKLETQNFSPEQAEILKKLTKSQSTKERVKLFGKVMDTYGIDPIVWLIPAIGDGWISLIASTYLLSEWKKIWLWFVDMLKIVWYQSADFVVWAIPLLWDISDFLFKSNKRSAKIFEKHFQKLKKEALAKWISPQDIAKIELKNKNFLLAINKYMDIKKSNKSV